MDQMKPEIVWALTSLYKGKLQQTKASHIRIFYTGIGSKQDTHTIEEFKFVCHDICKFGCNWLTDFGRNVSVGKTPEGILLSIGRVQNWQ